MASHSLAQSKFPPATVISVYLPKDVDFNRMTTRAPMSASPVAGVSAGVATGKASVVTGVVGNNNAIKWEAKTTGTVGNAITVTLLNEGASQTLDVDVVGTNISVSLATNGSSVITSTANDVKAAIAAHTGANALVTATDSSTSDGTGVVVAVSLTSLASGTDAVATNQALVAADGTLTVDVTLDASYYAVGSVGGEYRYLRFHANA